MKRLAVSAALLVLTACVSGFGAALPADVAEQVAKFKDPNPKVRQQALTALGKLGDKAKPALPEITEMVNDKHTWVMTRALMVLPDIGPDETTVKPLLPFLSRDKDVRDMAVLVYVKIGEKAVPSLVEALKDEKSAEGACDALAGIGPAAKAAVPDVTAVMQKGKTKPVKDAAAKALKAISK